KALVMISTIRDRYRVCFGILQQAPERDHDVDTSYFQMLAFDQLKLLKREPWKEDEHRYELERILLKSVSTILSRLLSRAPLRFIFGSVYSTDSEGSELILVDQGVPRPAARGEESGPQRGRFPVQTLVGPDEYLLQVAEEEFKRVLL